MKRRIRIAIAVTASLGSAVLLANPAAAITPEEWGMSDGIGVGKRVTGTPCLASEAHQWADSADGSGYALWCPPPKFVWVSSKP